MESNAYQVMAHTYCTAGSDSWSYALHGLVEEVGEVCGKFAKYQRKNIYTPSPTYTFAECKRKSGLFSKGHLRDADIQFLRDLSKELGDACWMLAELCTQYGLKLDRVMRRNLAKLSDRQMRGVIIGEGDER